MFVFKRMFASSNTFQEIGWIFGGRIIVWVYGVYSWCFRKYKLQSYVIHSIILCSVAQINIYLQLLTCVTCDIMCFPLLSLSLSLSFYCSFWKRVYVTHLSLFFDLQKSTILPWISLNSFTLCAHWNINSRSDYVLMGSFLYFYCSIENVVSEMAEWN